MDFVPFFFLDTATRGLLKNTKRIQLNVTCCNGHEWRKSAIHTVRQNYDHLISNHSIC